MKIISIIFQDIAPILLLIGSGIVLLYTVISIQSGVFEWLTISIGLILVTLVTMAILMVRFVQKHKQISWNDALFGLFVWP
jgi:uncharacterized membrane protein SirB2